MEVSGQVYAKERAANTNWMRQVGSGADLILQRQEKSLALCREPNPDSSAIRPAAHLYI
jgi:hypothetical protein